MDDEYITLLLEKLIEAIVGDIESSVEINIFADYDTGINIVNINFFEDIQQNKVELVPLDEVRENENVESYKRSHFLRHRTKRSR